MKKRLTVFLIVLFGFSVIGCTEAAITTTSKTYHRAETYGSVPSKFVPLIEGNLLRNPILSEDCFFIISDVEDHHEISRFDYDFTQMSLIEFETASNEYSYRIDWIIATKDEGFVYSLRSNGYFDSAMDVWVDSNSILFKCDGTGTVEWQREFSGYSETILDFFFEDSEGCIYVFGTNEEDPSKPHYTYTDVHAFKLDHSGQILVEKSFGGSDFDLVNSVKWTETGIVARITSQSRDGDFPISEDGYRDDIFATFDENLNLISYQLDDSELTTSIGKVLGSEVYFQDGIISFGDVRLNFEEGRPTTAVGYDDCFVIVSWNKIGEQESPPLVSSILEIFEIVYSAYDNNLNLLWREVVQPT